MKAKHIKLTVDLWLRTDTKGNENCLDKIGYEIIQEYLSVRRDEQSRDEEDFESQQLREKFRKQQQALRDKWAKENARFKIGDIIKADYKIIEVERIRGCFESFYKNPYVMYYGKIITKALKPRKDESRTSTYDDGREIIKLK